VPLPECFVGIDNVGDSAIDFPADPGCQAAGDDMEIDECAAGIGFLYLPPDGEDLWSTSGLSNFSAGCTLSDGPEAIYLLQTPAEADLHISTDYWATGFDTVVYVRTVCDDPSSEIGCNDNASGSTMGSALTLPALAAGTYWIFVDGLWDWDWGTYQISVHGDIAPGGPCDPLDLIFTCDAAAGYFCDGAPGAEVCTPALCADGIDNDFDGQTDFPWDPGCDSPADNDETDPAAPPECADGTDNDTDGDTDYPDDLGCSSAADDNEADECGAGVAVTDVTTEVTSAPGVEQTFDGTTSGWGSFSTANCGFATEDAGEAIYAVRLDSPATSLRLRTMDPPSGWGFDTVIYVRLDDCTDPGAELDCNDDDMISTYSDLTIFSPAAGVYWLFVDGYGGTVGDYQVGITLEP